MTPETPDARARLYARLPVTDDVEWWTRLAGEAPGGRVLYLGCGTGRLALPMAAACDELVGVDPDPAMLAAFHERLVDGPVAGRVTLLEARGEDLTGEHGFGLVVAPSSLLNELPDEADRVALLRGAASHCRPDGRVVVQVLNPYPMVCEEGELWGTVGDSDDTVGVTIETLRFDAFTQQRLGRLTYTFGDGTALVDELEAVALFPGDLHRHAADAGLRVAAAWGATPGQDPPGRYEGSWHLELVPV